MKKYTLAKIGQSFTVATSAFSPNEENVQAILDWIMPDLDPNELKKNLVYYYKYKETGDKRYIPYFDPVPALFANYKFLQKHQKTFSTFRDVLKGNDELPDDTLDDVGLPTNLPERSSRS